MRSNEQPVLQAPFCHHTTKKMDAGPSSLEEDNEELYLPRSQSHSVTRRQVVPWRLFACPLPAPCVAAVNKLIKEAVPHLRVSVDARELLLKCSTGRQW